MFTGRRVLESVAGSCSAPVVPRPFLKLAHTKLRTHPHQLGLKGGSLSLSLPGLGVGASPPLPPHAYAHLQVLAGF